MVVLIKLKFNTRGVGGGAGAREVRYRLTVMQDTKLRNLGMKLKGFWGQGVKSSHNS